MMKKFICIMLAGLMMISFTSCNNSKKNPSNQTIYYNLEEDPNSLDPQVSNNDSAEIIITNIFEGLTRIQQDNTLVAGVAEKFSHNEDYTSFTFYLRDDTFWSDKNKTRVTADDFVYGIKRAVTKETGCPGAKNLFCIKNAKKIYDGENAKLGVQALDPNTLQIDLEYSYDDFPRLMAMPEAMPCNQAFFESTSGQYGQEEKTIICNGPFRLKSKYGWDHNNKIYLLANEGYKGYSERIPASLEFTIGEDSSDLINLINKGKVDAGELPFDQFDKAKELKYNITSFEDTTYGICFNFSDEVFNNLKVRKSFITSLDREYILKNIPNNSNIANDIVMESDIIDGKNYRDLAGRNLYLKQEENPKGYLTQGLKELNMDSLPPVTILCNDDDKTKSMVSCIIENLNSKLGYYFNMKPLKKGEIDKRILLSDYQIAITSITSQTNDPIGILSMFRTNNPENICDMKNNYYDSLIDQSYDASIESKISLYKEAEEFLNQQCAFYPLYYQNRYFASAANVSGIVFYQHNAGVDFINAVKTKK